MTQKLLFLSLALLLSSSLFAQFRLGMIPRVSPDVDITYKIAYTNISIRYSSPSVKGRKIWGALVPYERVWRAGANEATAVDFSQDVLIDGKKVPKGSYSFFIIPREKGPWTVILNKAAKQWGAFGYDSAKDYLRLEVTPTQSEAFAERLHYQLVQEDLGAATMIMNWEKLQISVHIQVPYLDHLLSTIDSVLDQTSDEFKWVIYFQGAEFLLNTQQKTELALEWAEASLAKKKYSDTYWIKAQLLARLQRYREAVGVLDELLTLARSTGKKTIYSDKKTEIDLAYAEWRKK